MGMTQDLLSFSSHRTGLPVCGFATWDAEVTTRPRRQERREQ